MLNFVDTYHRQPILITHLDTSTEKLPSSNVQNILLKDIIQQKMKNLQSVIQSNTKNISKSQNISKIIHSYNTTPKQKIKNEKTNLNKKNYSKDSYVNIILNKKKYLIDKKEKENRSTKKGKSKRNTSLKNKSNTSLINKKNINEDIINVRKKLNEVFNNFYTTPKDYMKTKQNKKSFYKDRTILTKTYEIKKNNIDNNNDNIYSNYSYSNLNTFWQLRNLKTLNKLEEIKKEKLLKEENELKFIPKINSNSIKIISQKVINDIHFNNLYDKLTYHNNAHFSNLLNNENNNKNNIACNEKAYKPIINSKSKKLKRDINDLYIWQNKKENKLKRIKSEIYTIKKTKNINQFSEEILKRKRPIYLNKKVEDRLIEQGLISKLKTNDLKEKNLQEITKQKTFVNDNYKNINCKYLDNFNNNENNKNEYNQIDFDDIIKLRNVDNFSKKKIFYGSKELNNYYKNNLNNHVCYGNNICKGAPKNISMKNEIIHNNSWIYNKQNNNIGRNNNKDNIYNIYNICDVINNNNSDKIESQKKIQSKISEINNDNKYEKFSEDNSYCDYLKNKKKQQNDNNNSNFNSNINYNLSLVEMGNNYSVSVPNEVERRREDLLKLMNFSNNLN